MRLISWNVQWCRGLDGRVDPARIVAEARALADFDVLCVQELADNFPAPLLAGNDDGDQFAQLAALLPGYTMIAGIAVDHPGDGGRRRRFGNAIYSRLPVLQAFRWTLPWPADPGVPTMPRVAVEAVLDAPGGALRVITAHLEYYSQAQRSAQIEALRDLYAEGSGHARSGTATRAAEGPFRAYARPKAALVTGDFNLPAGDPLHLRMQAPFADGTAPLVDAWSALHPGLAQPPTFCVHEPYAPGLAPYACDFAFVSPAARSRLSRMAVGSATRASDHQPLLVTLD
jgi:endonuclease/exonuclease/phosphatase family metal-dependent hydrolase